MMFRIYSRHWTISRGRHFQNDRHNTAQIQHCPISTTFHFWVDYDVPNRFLSLKNFYLSPFSKWPPQYYANSTLSDFNDISYVGRLWCPELIPDIEKFLPVSIFKMAATIPQKFNIVRFQRFGKMLHLLNIKHWIAAVFLTENALTSHGSSKSNKNPSDGRGISNYMPSNLGTYFGI